MSDFGQSGSAPADSNHSDCGQCSFCAAPNPRTNIACHFCGSRLPWTFEIGGDCRFDARLYLARLQPGKQPVAPIADSAPAADNGIIKDTFEPQSYTERPLHQPFLPPHVTIDTTITRS